MAPQEAMAIVIMVTSSLQLWGDGVNGQKPLPKGTQALSLLSIMDVPPLIAVPFFPTENSLGRRGASSRLRSARRQSRTVLHRLTGHFGRRGQGGMKTNVSPTSTPTSPRHVSEAPLLLCPFPCLSNLLRVACSFVRRCSRMALCSIPCSPTSPFIPLFLASL